MRQTIEHALPTVTPATPVSLAIAQLHQAATGLLLVVDTTIEAPLLGLLAERDVVRLVATGVDLTALRVADVMMADCPCLYPADLADTQAILNLFQQTQLPALPLVNAQKQPVGLISSQQLLQTFQQQTADSEARFRSLVEQAAVGLAQISLEGRWLLVNQALCRMLGYLADELLATTERAVLYAADFPATQVYQQSLLAGDARTYSLEERFIRKDESIVWVSSSTSLVCNPSGEPQYFIKVVNDISDRKQAETALRRQLKRALLLQKITDAIRSQLDPQNIFATTVNQIGQALNVNRCLLLTHISFPKRRLPIAAEYVEPNYQSLAGRVLPVKTNRYLLQVLSQDQAVSSPNVYADPLLQPVQTLCQQVGLRSMLAVRTSYQGKANGALALQQCDRFRQWTTSEIQLLEAIAAQVGIALAQIRLLEQEQQQRQEMDQQNALLKSEIAKREQTEAELELFFAQSLDGFFFMMLDEPIPWSETADQEALLDYVFAHQRVTRVNDAMLNQYGATRKQFVGLTPNDLFAYDLEQGRTAWRNLFNAGRLHVETCERKVDGTPIWIEGDYICLYDRQGNLTGHFGVQRDVSARHRSEMERQRAEAALRESEERFRQLAENINAVFWLFNSGGAEEFYVSPAYERIWGQSPDVVLPKSSRWLSTIHPADRDRVVASLALQMQRDYEQEYRIIRADGAIRWIRDRSFPIKNLSGHIYRVAGIAEDITDYKRQQESLRLIFEGTAAKTGSEFFHSLVRYLAEVLQVRYAFVSQLVGPERKIARTLAFWYGNEFGENFEYELAGTSCEDILHGEIIYYGEGIQATFPHHAHLADLAVESYFGVPLYDSSRNVIGHLKVLDTKPLVREPASEQILHIFAARAGAELERMRIAQHQAELLAQTQQQSAELAKAKDAAEAASHAKSEFLANVSHELRTPLNAILGFTQIMSRDELKIEHREYINIINRSGQHLLQLINDVLEMSKIEAGRHRLNATSFDLYHLLDTLYEMLSLKARVKHLSLTFDRAHTVPQYITTDEGKLRQVLLNLLGNAIKFTTAGGVTLKVTDAGGAVASPHHEVDTYHLQFEVKDTGVGIAPDEMSRLFIPFVQTRAGQQSFEGTGLGLAISQTFVQLMDGNISVESEVNHGSLFRFDIRAKPAPDTIVPSSQPAQRVVGLAPHQPRYRLLIMEDRWENRQLLIQLLQPLGFDVQVAVDGAEGVAIWESWQPDLILMDMRMPVMNGYEATQRIKATPRGQKTVIIAVTSSAFEEDRAEILSLGCDDFVSKPFHQEEIFAKLALHLGVQYVYETDNTLSPLAPLPAAATDWLTPESLQMMPASWIARLHEAAVQGREGQILTLLQQIPATHSDLARALQTLTHDFRFGEIADLTKLP